MKKQKNKNLAGLLQINKNIYLSTNNTNILTFKFEKKNTKKQKKKLC